MRAAMTDCSPEPNEVGVGSGEEPAPCVGQDGPEEAQHRHPEAEGAYLPWGDHAAGEGLRERSPGHQVPDAQDGDADEVEGEAGKHEAQPELDLRGEARGLRWSRAAADGRGGM